MKKLNKYIALFSIGALLGVSACNDDDATGYSTMVPTNPTISVTGSGGTSDEANGDVYTFDITLSEPQTVDVIVHITQIDGDATMDDDYSLSTARVVIGAYTTSGSFTVSILDDCDAEATETFKLQVGDERTANASISPVSADFSISNHVSNDLGIDLSWSTEIFDSESGARISGTDAADLRLLLVDAHPYSSILDGVDGGSFESFTLASDVADGEYYIATDFYSAMDLGDQGVFDVGVTLDLAQCGVAGGESYTFSTALNSAYICGNNHFYIAKITKSGSSYSFEPVGDLNSAASLIGGDYTELNDDGNPQTAAVTISTADADGYFTVSNAAFSSDWWCGHPDATMELAVDGLDIVFPDGAITQVIGGIDEMCGAYGPVSVTLQEPGSIDFCSGEITLEVEVTVGIGSFGIAILTYTPN